MTDALKFRISVTQASWIVPITVHYGINYLNTVSSAIMYVSWTLTSYNTTDE